MHHFSKRKNMSRPPCMLCGICKPSTKEQIFYCIPFVHEFVVCANCFLKIVSTCDTCVKLFHRFTQAIVVLGVHPTLDCIRNVRSCHVLASLSCSTHYELTRLCKKEFQYSWQQCFISHLIHVHVKPKQTRICCDCKKTNKKLIACQACFTSKCTFCFKRTECSMCKQTSCFDCFESCSLCKSHICLRCALVCQACNKSLCRDCSHMLYCDLCFNRICFHCQDTMQEFSDEHIVCCRSCATFKVNISCDDKPPPKPHILQTDLKVFKDTLQYHDHL